MNARPKTAQEELIIMIDAIRRDAPMAHGSVGLFGCKKKLLDGTVVTFKMKMPPLQSKEPKNLA